MEIATCHLWDHRKELAELVDVWEAAKTWPAVKAALKSNVDVAITLYRKDSC